MNGSTLSMHSPNSEATSDASSSSNAPTGLPHPKPKHNIRDQLIQAGFEPRGSNFFFLLSFTTNRSVHVQKHKELIFKKL